MVVLPLEPMRVKQKKRGIPDFFISLIFPKFLKTHNLSDRNFRDKAAYLTDVIIRFRPV